MPWKDQTIMEQKIEFICEWRTGKYTITELCTSFGISRPTAYKIIARFEQEGYEGLRELSRKPRSIHPNASKEKVVNKILELKGNHKLRGAKMILKLLNKDYQDEDIEHNYINQTHSLISGLANKI